MNNFKMIKSYQNINHRATAPSLNPQKTLAQFNHNQTKTINPKQEKNRLQTIHFEINEMKKLNAELINFSNNLSQIMRTQPNRNAHYQIREKFNGLENKLTLLIESIKDFFIDMDNKIKGLASLLLEQENEMTKMSNDMQLQRDRKTVNMNQNPKNLKVEISNDAKFNQLANKINRLQKSLQETKSNESKLISVIETMMNRYGIKEESTMIRQHPEIQFKLSNYQNKKNAHSPNILQLQGSLDESVVTSNLNQIKNKEREINRNHVQTFYSGNYNVHKSYDPQNTESFQQIRSPQKGLQIKAKYSQKGIETRGYGVSYQLAPRNRNQSNNYQYLSTQKDDRNRRMQFMMNKLVL